VHRNRLRSKVVREGFNPNDEVQFNESLAVDGFGGRNECASDQYNMFGDMNIC
jgi:hypothetical protein